MGTPDKRRNVLTINFWWAGIFATLFAAAITGGFQYAWANNADTAVMKTDIASAKKDIQEIKDLQLDRRLTRMEASLEFLVREARKDQRY